MTVVFKYPLTIAEFQTLKIPETAEILSIQLQESGPCLWALVDPAEPCVERLIMCLGTGIRIATDKDALKHLGTVIEGRYVWHFFERIEIQ